jgi:hypothetical protein
MSVVCSSFGNLEKMSVDMCRIRPVSASDNVARSSMSQYQPAFPCPLVIHKNLLNYSQEDMARIVGVNDYQLSDPRWCLVRINLSPDDEGQRSLHNVIFEVFTAVIMKNIVSCDTKTQFLPHRRHNKSPLQSPAN